MIDQTLSSRADIMGSVWELRGVTAFEGIRSRYYVKLESIVMSANYCQIPYVLSILATPS